MSIRTVDPTCRRCGRALKDVASRYRRVGPECWSKLTAPEQAEALEQAKAERDPFHIPEQASPSAQALLNRLNARRAAAGEDQLCHHENVAGKCPDCRWEADPDNASVRILREVCGWSRSERHAERARVLSARYAHVTGWTPPPRPKPAAHPAKPKTRRPHTTGQLELL